MTEKLIIGFFTLTALASAIGHLAAALGLLK